MNSITTKTQRISPVATRSLHERVAVIDAELVRQKAQDARSNRRKREIHNFHTGNDDTLQRMLNAIQPGSYIVPHRHTATPKAESLVVLHGSAGFVVFDDSGVPDATHFVLLNKDAGVFGVDYRAGVWHTFFALEPDTVIFEVKPGPYDASTDKEFAPWAPSEDDPAAQPYLAELERTFRTTMGLTQAKEKRD